MTDHHVIDHHHDPEEGVYRIVVGIPVYDQQPVLDEDGLPKLGENDEPELEDVLLGYSHPQDFVFAADDERWLAKGGKARNPGEVAAEQRRIVRDALAQQERERAELERKVAQRKGMPGVGKAL